MQTSKAYKGLKNDIKSSLIRTFKDISDSASVSLETSGMYGWVKKVTINDSLVIQESDGFDIYFNIPFDDDPEVNESTVTIYNLASTTLSQIKKDSTIIVEAGYEKDSTGQILSGKVVKINSYWEGVDYVTEITANDYYGTEDTTLNDISFSKNTPASQILQDLCNRLGIPVAIFQISRDHVFENSVKVNGSLMDGIRKYAKVCGVHAWINKSSLYVCALDVPVTESYFDLKSDTGLLSVEEWQEEETNEDYSDVIYGVTAKMLLQHRIYTGCTIQITSQNINGRFKVREGEHVADDDEFITTVKAVRMG